MDIVLMAREMGKELQKSEEYANLQKAMKANDNDSVLQDLIGAFNIQRIALNTEMQKKEADEVKIKDMNTALQKVYGQIMANPSMVAYNEAKQAMDALMNRVNTVLIHSVNGADPDTCPDHEESCGGSCATCGGCH